MISFLFPSFSHLPFLSVTLSFIKGIETEFSIHKYIQHPYLFFKEENKDLKGENALVLITNMC